MSKTPNVAPSVALYLPQLSRGGAEWALLRLGCALRDRGLACSFILDRHDGPLLADAAAAGLGVEALGAGRTLAAIARLAHWLRERQPAVLLSAISHNNIAAVIASRLAGGRTRIIVSEHTMLSAQSRDHAGWQHRLMPLLARCCYPLAAARVAVAEAVADDLAAVTGLARASIAVVPNPVVTPDFPARMAAAPPHPWLSDGGAPVVVAAGRLVAVKGFDLLLQALAQLRRERPVRLVIFGEGPERARLEPLVASLGLTGAVALPGAIDDVLPAFARAAAVVVSSRFEGFGLVLVEAMACGTPVVSTDCPGGPREILDHGRYGPLATANNPAALATALSSVLNGPLAPALLRARANCFTAESSAGRMIALFKAIGIAEPWPSSL